MKPTSGYAVPVGPQSTRRRPSSELQCNSVFGFPVAENQYSIFNAQSAVESSGQVQGEDTLDNPRTTRLRRFQAAREAAVDGRQPVGGILDMFTQWNSDAQRTFDNSGIDVKPVASTLPYAFFDSLSVQNFELEAGNSFIEDAVYNMGSVKDMDCTDFNCNKRISNAGPDWSAGRPGHTPTRRDFACVKHVEDSCVGQEWSAGRPGTGPFGARTAACLSPQIACLGPYGTATLQ